MLVDTSVWIDYLRRGNAKLAQLLSDDQVLCHRFIVGELACGWLKNRQTILTFLSKLPQATSAAHDEVLDLLQSRQLFAKGIGWIDAHLLAATLLSHSRIWTTDRHLMKSAHDMNIAEEVTS
ncbi:MAG TPA: PIN domain-containing protein [Tepidisphaeraceae bacterium]|nr:PIN domain-containing protein [Tepidisphaeraceae bacterium]